jgi:hypothetical protein
MWAAPELDDGEEEDDEVPDPDEELLAPADEPLVPEPPDVAWVDDEPELVLADVPVVLDVLDVLCVEPGRV